MRFIGILAGVLIVAGIYSGCSTPTNSGKPITITILSPEPIMGEEMQLGSTVRLELGLKSVRGSAVDGVSVVMDLKPKTGDAQGELVYTSVYDPEGTPDAEGKLLAVFFFPGTKFTGAGEANVFLAQRGADEPRSAMISNILTVDVTF